MAHLAEAFVLGAAPPTLPAARLVSKPGRALREAPQQGGRSAPVAATVLVAGVVAKRRKADARAGALRGERSWKTCRSAAEELEEQEEFGSPTNQVPDDMMERLSSIDLSLEDEDEEEGEEALEFDPSEWDDMELDAEDEDMEVGRSQLEELEEEEPADEAALMKAVEVSDDEVSEFLAEFNAQPIVAKEPGTVPIDPFEKDATKELDTFKEMKGGRRDLMYARGMPSNQMVITLKDRLNMLSEHADNGEWRQARYIMKGIWRRRHLRLPLGRRMWNQMIKAHVNANRPMAAESWVKDMLNRVFQPDIYSYNTLLKCYGRRGDFLKAEKWIRRMRARGVAPDMYSYSSLVQAYVVADDVEGAERVFSKMEVTDASNTFAHNTLLKAYAQKEQAEKAEKLFKTMAKPDATTYLQMIRVAASVSDPEGAADWLRRMSEAGLQPWVPHFHAVMTAHAKMGDMEGAEAWFRVMLDEGMRPELVSCNILMSAAANGGDTAGAEGVLLRMEDLQLRPDVVTYSTLFSAFAKAGNAIGARDWLLQAEEAGIEPDLNCYKQIIKACVQSGDAAMAERMARRLLRNRLTPDVYTYNMLLNALAKAGNWASAEFWVDHMQRAARWKHNEFPLDQISVAYAEVFLAHVEAGDLEGAEAWIMQMVGEGIEPQARCYTALVQRYLDQGDLDNARRWLGRMNTWSNHSAPVNLLEAVEPERLLQEAVSS